MSMVLVSPIRVMDMVNFTSPLRASDTPFTSVATRGGVW